MARNENDQLFIINPTDKPFTFRWGGVDRTVSPGIRMIMPRFLAEHFAKKLADHILLGMEAKHKKDFLAGGGSIKDYEPKSYLNSKKWRPKTIDSILVGVYQYFEAQSGTDANALIEQQLQQMNPGLQEADKDHMNLGKETDPLLGVLSDDDEEDDDQPPVTPPSAVTLPPAQPQPPVAPQNPAPPVQTPPPVTPPTEPPVDPNAPKETGLQKRNRLFKEAKQLGIKVDNSMTSDMLEAEIKKQYA